MDTVSETVYACMHTVCIERDKEKLHRHNQRLAFYLQKGGTQLNYSVVHVHVGCKQSKIINNNLVALPLS